MINSVGEVMGNKHSHILLMGMHTGSALLKGIFGKSTHAPFHPAVPLLAVCLQNTACTIMKIHIYEVFLAASFIIVKYWK